MAPANVQPVSPHQEAEPGIVVFDSSMVVRYSNQRAKELLHRLQWEATESPAKSDLLHAIIDVGMRVRAQWPVQRETDDLTTGEARRTVETDGGPVAVHAFCVPEGECRSRFHIIVVIDGARQERRLYVALTGTRHSKGRYHHGYLRHSPRPSS